MCADVERACVECAAARAAGMLAWRVRAVEEEEGAVGPVEARASTLRFLVWRGDLAAGAGAGAAVARGGTGAAGVAGAGSGEAARLRFLLALEAAGGWVTRAGAAAGGACDEYVHQYNAT